LGSIKAAGLTKLQLKESIVKNLIDKKLLLDPIVNVRLVNYKVTVLGEVNKPSVIPVPNEKITLLEAIGFAGDLTLYAKRDNVLLIREEQGKKTIRRLNLSSSEIFNSPYYYLKSDDVVYVEANKAKVASTSSTRLWLPVLFSGLSLTAIVIDRITR
jgi:polysaccharide export outer membrane protein